MQSTSPTNNKPAADKKDAMDIDVIIDKIDKMPIPDADKASLLNQIKQNMMNPSRGEDENLNRIQSKYMNPTLFPTYPIPGEQSFMPPNPQQPHSHQPHQTHQPHQPHQPHQQLQQQQFAMQNPMQNQFMPYQNQNQMYSQMMMQPPTNLMTTAHFEILKNKIDSVQFELVDLLRHVKDYTQRYMNATRQQDMEKIDAYVNGLFEVDKKMKEADEKAAEYEANPDEEEEPQTRESIIGKATSGIKNFLGSIGDNVAGLATMATNTANIANSYLSKKVISGNTSNASPQVATKPELNTSTGTNTNTTTNTAKKNTNTNTSTNTNTNTNTSTNKNIVSVDDYMNGTQESTDSNTSSTSITPGNIITTSSNNINKLETTNPSSQSKAEEEEKAEEEAKEDKADTPTEDDITKAINKLNDSMNEDINNTVKEGDIQINTTTPTPATATAPTAATATVQSGGKHESRLTKKIKLLRLKLTKNKLQRELQKELQKKNKTNHIVKQTVSQNKKHSSGKKYSMKKNKRN
jgi:hypothetical protein